MLFFVSFLFGLCSVIFRHGFPGKHIGVNAHVVFDSRLVLEIAELFVVYVVNYP